MASNSPAGDGSQGRCKVEGAGERAGSFGPTTGAPLRVGRYLARKQPEGRGAGVFARRPTAPSGRFLDQLPARSLLGAQQPATGGRLLSSGNRNSPCQ